MSLKPYPMIFQPVLKDYLWGGRTLETKLNRKLPDGIIAESWEIAAHKDGTTVVTNGTYAGLPLTRLLQKFGLDLIGTRNSWAPERNKFPLLIKLLDAQRPLSLQVHPDDEYARANENELGKTEMWYVLHAEADAKIILGLQHRIDRNLFRQAIHDSNLEQYLHEIPVKTGDHVCLPAGTLHSILGGSILAEIQQNSNTTYRVYDWNREGTDGKPRRMHIEKALDVINFDCVKPDIGELQLISQTNALQQWQLCTNRYFCVEKLEIEAGSCYKGICDGSSFEIWGIISGDVLVKTEMFELALSAVQFTLLPAKLGEFIIEPEKNAILLRIFVPKI